jgi:S-DNA-T family DNA segregation ATPase FtsK/SpoIIIE
VTGSPQPPVSRAASRAWQYRRELIPVWVGLAFLVIASIAHASARNGWALALPVGAVTTAAWRWRAGQGRQQVYAVAVGAAATLWFTAAWSVSPWHTSLIVLLLMGVIAAAIPLWRRDHSAHTTPHTNPQANPHTTAHTISGGLGSASAPSTMQDLRQLSEEWPERAAAAELVGSTIHHSQADKDGYALTVALRPGQTVADVMTRLPRLESALQAPPGGLHVLPDPGRADRCQIRVVWNDPLAATVPWHVPSGQSIADPLRLGLFSNGNPVEVSLLGEHMLMAGTARCGKSGVLNVVTAELAARSDIVLWGIDCREGLELAPWQLVLDRWAVSADEGTSLLEAANRVIDARARLLAARGERTWRPAPEEPALFVLVDELSELSSEAIGLCERLVRRGRPVRIGLVATTHQASAAALLGGLDLRTQLAVRVCLGLVDSRDVDRILGPGRWAGGWCADRLRLPGSFLIHVPGVHETPCPARAFWLSEEEVARTAARFSTDRPALDPASAAAAGRLPASSRLVVER